MNKINNIIYTKDMNKLLYKSLKNVFILLSIIVICYFSHNNVVFASEGREIIQIEYGRVINDNKSKIVLYGNRVSEGGYFDNIVLGIYTNDKCVEIPLRHNYGYSPSIMVGDFSSMSYDEIYFCSESGGSGAFQYSILYNIANDKITILFDSDNTINKYRGKYKDNYKVEINQNAETLGYIDISNRDKDYLRQIYDIKGKLLKNKDIYVSDVNRTIPIYDFVKKKYNLQVYYRITGLYNADSLGYVIDWYNFEPNAKVYFNLIGVNY